MRLTLESNFATDKPLELYMAPCDVLICGCFDVCHLKHRPGTDYTGLAQGSSQDLLHQFGIAPVTCTI